MIKIFGINIFLFVLLFLQFSVNSLIGQEKKAFRIKAGLTIEGVVRINIHGIQQNKSIDRVQQEKLWIIDELIYGIPKITQSGLNIKLETNHPSSVLYIETSSKNGNLSNGINELQTFYLLTLDEEEILTSLNPRWKQGTQIRQFIQKIEKPGIHSFNLFASLFADSSCSFGIYRDELHIVLIGSDGKKHVKKIGIQAELNEMSAVKRMRSEEYKPDNVDNNKFEPEIQFLFDSDKLSLSFEKSVDNKYHIGVVPISIIIAQKKIPCTVILETNNAKNYFTDDSHYLKTTDYYLSSTDWKLNDISPTSWEDGIRLRTFLQRLTQKGKYQWKLWVRIHDRAKSTYKNIFNILVIDAKGKRYLNNIEVTFE